ncbi:MAG: HAMP domain-containing protein [Chloroflexi bacterium]|nr:HAMP domain-containing protein [Chloroflexota bacterium]
MAKLVLAFLLTSVAGMALAVVFVRYSVTRGFDDYVVEQQRSGFITDVTTYYETTGSWNGVDRWLQARGRRRGGPLRNQTIPPGGPAGGPPLRFVLADPSGTVVVPAEGYRPGDRVPDAELTRGLPLSVNGQVVGTVITPSRTVFRDPGEERYLARTDWALVGAGAVSVVIALSLGLLLARVITRPLRELTAASRRIAAGDLSQQVPVRSQDELGLLADQFNQMSADLAKANALRRQMTADIAHDLRTPLTVIAGYLEALRDGVLKATPERFTTLHGETQLLLRLVEDLHTLSRADAGELALNLQIVAPHQLLERVADTYRHVAEREGIELRVETGAHVPAVEVDPESLVRVLGNLVSNAIRHTPSGGGIVLRTSAAVAGVQIAVADTGDGIPPEHLPSIFERFYRVDPSRTQATGGSGLGLAIVKSLVEAHHGRVSVASAPGEGTTFTLTLPTPAPVPVSTVRR